MHPVGMHNAFRFAGGPPGIDQHAGIIFRRLRLQPLRRVACGLREDVELPRPGSKAKQVQRLGALLLNRERSCAKRAGIDKKDLNASVFDLILMISF